MKQARLPKSFAFRTAKDLIRVGKSHDGGYLIASNDIDQTDLLISLGVNDDWSFEEHFQTLHDTQIISYDGSISERIFRKQFRKSILSAENPAKTIRKLKSWLGYQKFFSQPNVQHVQKFVGMETDDTRYCSLSQILEGRTESNIFLKVDIEGSEYRIFEDLIRHQDRLTGLAIELHDCDLHLQSICHLIHSLRLNLVHIHAVTGGSSELTINFQRSWSSRSVGTEIYLKRCSYLMISICRPMDASKKSCSKSRIKQENRLDFNHFPLRELNLLITPFRSNLRSPF